MPLRRLYGPSPILDGYSGAECSGFGNAFYHPFVGLFGHASFYALSETEAANPVGAFSGPMSCALDGVAYEHGNHRQGVGWWAPVGRMVSPFNFGSPTGIREILYDVRGLTAQKLDEGLNGDFFNNYIKMGPNHFVYFVSGLITEFDQNKVVLAQTPNPYGLNFGVVSTGRSIDEIFVGNNFTGSPPRGFFWSISQRKATSPLIWLPTPEGGGTYPFMSYVPEFGVIIGLRTITVGGRGVVHIEVFSLETVPTQVSAPVLVGGLTKAGQRARYRVRVLGSNNDICENQKVDWSVSGGGTVLTPQSMTDANGYAEAEVLYNVGESGTSTVRGAVVC